MIAKRTFDAVASAVALIVFLPLLLAVAIWIKTDNPGPVFFRQHRVGRHGRVFSILKFRSMRVANEGPKITVTGDARITRSGSFLRKYKLDELPQLWNVLVGDMSLVGPRPEVQQYVACWPDEVRGEILSIRPGITDPTALEMFDEAALLAASSDPERKYIDEILPLKVAGYVRYVRKRSFAGDLSIIFRTIGRAFRA